MTRRCHRCGATDPRRYCGSCGAIQLEPDAGANAEQGPSTAQAAGRPKMSAAVVFVVLGVLAAVAVAGVIAAVGVVAFQAAAGAGYAPDNRQPLGAPGAGGMPGAPAPFGASGPGAPVDLSTMTAAEAADRLYNRINVALQGRDTIEVMNFLPMALDAHELARPLNELRLFRLSFLHRIAGDHDLALAAAEEGLEQHPDHLLLLSAAAEAARELGDDETARVRYAHLLRVWDREIARGHDDYTSHERLMPVIRNDAEEYLADT